MYIMNAAQKEWAEKQIGKLLPLKKRRTGKVIDYKSDAVGAGAFLIVVNTTDSEDIMEVYSEYPRELQKGEFRNIRPAGTTRRKK